ncbi:MAG: hypothetical protein Q9218_006450 [Villophora microphyllina]
MDGGQQSVWTREFPAICQEQPRGKILIVRDHVSSQYVAPEVDMSLQKRQDVALLSLDNREPESTHVCLESGDLARQVPCEPEKLAEWADLLVVVCMQACTIAEMLQGLEYSLLLRILRCWNVSKKIAIIPAMSQLVWDNPMTRKHLSKIRRKWNWVTVLVPLISESNWEVETQYEPWLGFGDCMDALHNQIDLLMLGHDLVPPKGIRSSNLISPHTKSPKLPLELWSIILECTGDWELAKTLGIYTNLPVPAEWKGFPSSIGYDFMPELEWTILTGSLQDIVRSFQTGGPPRSLSRLCVKLIFKFSRTDILSYIEATHRDLFWSQFGHTLIPTKASAVFGQTGILDWWLRSPSFLTKEYNTDALDLASKSGFVHVLQWWRDSGLHLRYTDAALEQASSQGQIEVLHWWRNASHGSHRTDTTQMVSSHTTIAQSGGVNDSKSDSADSPPLRLKVGKSLIYAAQNGQAAAIRWWMSSGIPTVHEESVARAASANGHVNVLQLWKDIKGEKMQYDNQVLAGPTRNGHVDVLEWWKMSGYRVEYKTCDIEEALEDSIGGQKETSIRNWWANNGLNLGVGTTVAVSPAQYQLGVMSHRRAPLQSVPNAVNSPYRVPSAAAIKRSRQQLDQEDVLYDQQPPAKRSALSNGRLALRTPPQKPSLQQTEARVFGKRLGNAQPTAFERRLLEAKEKKTLEIQEREHEQKVQRTRNALDGCEGIRQWQKHYRKVFPTFVFYFESVPDEARARNAKLVRAFGAREEKFFSKEVTHIITSRAVPGDNEIKGSTDAQDTSTSSSSQHAYQPRTVNPQLLERNAENKLQSQTSQIKTKFDFDTAMGRKASIAGIPELESKKTSGTVDILQRAKGMGIKIWSLEKLERICKTMLDDRTEEPSLRGLGGRGTALNAAATTKPRGQAELSNLLRKEQLNGPSDASNLTSGLIPFKGPHIYVRCMDEKTKPILVKEFPRVARREDGEWPQFRGNAAGKCPFIVDYSAQRQEVERPQPKVQRAQEEEAIARRQTLRSRPAQANMVPSTRRVEYIPSKKEPLGESRGNGNTVVAPKASASGQENSEPLPDVSEKPDTSMKAPSQFPAAARLRFFNGEPAASGMQPSNITSAIRSQMISSTAAQPGIKAGTSKEIHGLQRKVLEKNSGPNLQTAPTLQKRVEPLGAARAERHIPLARQTRRQAQERLVHIEEEESTQSEEEEDVWRTADVQRRHVIVNQAPRRDPKPGYCENCKDKYDDFDAHILDRKHRRFAVNPNNWRDLDGLLALLGRPLKEGFDSEGF